MCEKDKKYKFYKKIISDNQTEVVYVCKPEKWDSYKIVSLEFENGFRFNKQVIDNSMEGGKEKYLEVTKPISPIWETIFATKNDIKNLIKCYKCEDPKECIGCNKKGIYIEND